MTTRTVSKTQRVISTAMLVLFILSCVPRGHAHPNQQSHSHEFFRTKLDNTGRVVVGDFDNDGDIDLAWVSASDQSEPVVLLNDGDGNYAIASDNSVLGFQSDDPFGSKLPSDPHKVKRGHKTSSLGSSTYRDVGPAVLDRTSETSIDNCSNLSFYDAVSVNRAFSSIFHKRGPPSSLS